MSWQAPQWLADYCAVYCNLSIVVMLSADTGGPCRAAPLTSAATGARAPTVDEARRLPRLPFGLRRNPEGHCRNMAKLRLSDQRLSPSLREQFVQGVPDAAAFLAQGFHEFAQLLVWNRDNFQRMQDDLNIFDLEGWIESRVIYFPER